MLNIVLRPHYTWAVCAYDERTLTDEMIDDLHATHPLIAHDHHHQPNDRYQHPVDFLVKHRDHPPDPVERTTPAVELVDPSPATVRATVTGVARRNRLPTDQVDNLVFSTHEAVTNALLHGRPLTVLRLWTQPDRVTITITDTGPGPTDPLVGLLPPDPTNHSTPRSRPRNRPRYRARAVTLTAGQSQLPDLHGVVSSTSTPDRGGVEVDDGHRPPGVDAVHAGPFVGLDLQQLHPAGHLVGGGRRPRRPWESASMIGSRRA